MFKIQALSNILLQRLELHTCLLTRPFFSIYLHRSPFWSIRGSIIHSGAEMIWQIPSENYPPSIILSCHHERVKGLNKIIIPNVNLQPFMDTWTQGTVHLELHNHVCNNVNKMGAFKWKTRNKKENAHQCIRNTCAPAYLCSHQIGQSCSSGPGTWRYRSGAGGSESRNALLMS